MGLDFIDRTFRTTVIVALLAALCLTIYQSGNVALGFLVGVAWSLINFYLMKRLIIEVLSPNERRTQVTVLIAFIKFPILYAVGYLIIASDYFSIYALLAGFSLILLVMLLKALSRMILRMDPFGFDKKHAEGTH